MREAKVAQWVLVSTLINPVQVSKEELNALYVQRWQIELDLRAIKTVMGMEILRCKSPQMVQKEVGDCSLNSVTWLARSFCVRAHASLKIAPLVTAMSPTSTEGAILADRGPKAAPVAGKGLGAHARKATLTRFLTAYQLERPPGSARHCGWMFAARAAFAHFSVSDRIFAMNCAEVDGMGFRP